MKNANENKKTNTKKPNTKKTVALLVAGAIVVTAVSGGIYVSAQKKRALAETVEQPQSVFVEKRDLDHSISVSGTIVSAESHTLTTTVTEAKVKTVDVQVGDLVKAGDVIATLDTGEIERQLALAKENLQLANARAGMDISSAQRNYESAATEAQIQTARAEAEAENAKQQYQKAVAEANSADGQYQAAVNERVNRELLAAAAQQELVGASAALAEKENALQKAQAKAEAKKGTEEEKQAAQAAAQAQNDYNAAKQKVAEKEEENQSVLTAVADAKAKEAEIEAATRQAYAGIEAAQTTMKKTEEAKHDAGRNVQKAVADQKDAVTGAKLSASANRSTPEQEVEKYEKQLKDCTITAPSDGIVTSVSVRAGEPVKNGEIAVVQNNENYRVAAAVDQYDISDIEKGMKAIIKTATTGEEQMQGELTFISPTPKVVAGENGAASSNGDYEVEVAIKNPSDRLRIGMNAKLTIVLQEKKGVLTVPGNCVKQNENGENYITVAEGEGENYKVQDIVVEYGLKTDYYVEITGEGLKENMQVLVPLESGADSAASGNAAMSGGAASDGAVSE